METYYMVFLPTTGILVTDEEEDNKTRYSWADDIEMRDLREANKGRDLREYLRVATREHVDAKPELRMMTDYQYFKGINDMEGM